MRNLTALVERWRRSGIELLPPRSPEDVANAFASVGAVATSDVVTLYASIGGIPVMDDDNWCLWSLEEIKERNQASSSFGVLFADYFIDCWCYRLRANDAATSSVLVDRFDETEPSVVAESPGEFVDLYFDDPNGLLHATSSPKSRALSSL